MEPTSIRIEFSSFALIISRNTDTNEVIVVRESIRTDEDLQDLEIVYSEIIASEFTVGPAEDWYCNCDNPFGPGKMLNSGTTPACSFCGTRAPQYTKEEG